METRGPISGGVLVLRRPALTAIYSPTINSYRRYVPGMWAPLTATWIPARDLHAGGRLRFTLGPQPSAWGTDSRPPSVSAENVYDGRDRATGAVTKPCMIASNPLFVNWLYS